MFEDILSDENVHWSGALYDTGIQRSCFSKLLSYFETGQVIAVTGVRRAGKSTLVRQLINHLIQEGWPARNILFFNLEHPYLAAYREDATTLQKLYKTYLKLAGPEGEVLICLDEVQFFRQWPLFVKSLFERKGTRFVITGSNAAMLSTDMITMLSGRSLPLEVYPFSFRETAISRGVDLQTPLAMAQQSSKLRTLFDEFLQRGGFPAILTAEHGSTASDILWAQARTVLLQDVAPRLGLRKPTALETLYVYLTTHIGKPMSYSAIAKLLDLTDKSVKEYMQALEDAHLLFQLSPFSFSVKKQLRGIKKIYSIDTGQAKAVGFQFSSNRGRLLENAVLVDLKRLGFDVYYYRTRSDKEVDFVIKMGSDVSLVQVSWSLEEQETLKREVSALKEAMDELQTERAIIITAEPHLQPSDIPIVSAHQLLAKSNEERKAQLLLL